MCSYNGNKNHRKIGILSVDSSLELFYFMLAASDPISLFWQQDIKQMLKLLG